MLGDTLKLLGHELAFTILEVGAAPVANKEKEPFLHLLDLFPRSRVLAFEVDATLCAEMNATAQKGHTYYPVALGRTEEERDFYETEKPMCASLYKPNEPLLDLFQNLKAAKLKSTSKLATVSLDQLVRREAIGPVDFIKIDIQGAELDVFQGGESALEGVLAIVTEVEFVPIYLGQPLFGDVCAYLSQKGFMFHKFLDLSGRALRPLVINGNENHAIQHLWSDAMFIRDLLLLERLSDAQLLKLAVLAEMYASPDVAQFMLRAFDQRSGSDLAKGHMRQLGSNR